MLPFEAVIAEQLLAEAQRIFVSGPALPPPLAAACARRHACCLAR